MDYAEDELVDFIGRLVGQKVAYFNGKTLSHSVEVIEIIGFGTKHNLMFTVGLGYETDTWFVGPDAPIHNFRVIKNDGIFYKEMVKL